MGHQPARPYEVDTKHSVSYLTERVNLNMSLSTSFSSDETPWKYIKMNNMEQFTHGFSTI